MKKFTYWRNAMVCEVYQVEAESEEQAVEQLMDGCHEPAHTEWVDWASDGYQLEGVEELCALYTMVKDYQCDTTS